MTPLFELHFDPDKAETQKQKVRSGQPCVFGHPFILHGRSQVRRLQRRVKRETKGAAREIQRDVVFIARVRFAWSSCSATCFAHVLWVCG